MNMYHTDAYRTAFLAYLRNGKPIRLSLKQLGATDQYVWRTQHDERVRTSHRVNDGRIFPGQTRRRLAIQAKTSTAGARRFLTFRVRQSSLFTTLRQGLRPAQIDGQTPTS